jgi:hypothetical protein
MIFCGRWRSKDCEIMDSWVHKVHIFTRDETGLVYLPTQLERTLQLYW